MGRSSYEQAAKNREKIVETASRLFRAQGVDNVSVSDIMTELGMTTGAFYKHFESKDALVQEAFAFSFRQSGAAWGRVSERKFDDPGERSAAIVNYYLQKKPPAQTCPMIAFAPHVCSEASDGLSTEAYREGTEGLFRQFVDHMRKSRPSDEADSATDQTAQVLFAAMVGANFLAQAMGDAKWLRSVQDAVREEAALTE
jgi:TetR/AcrR family transcriptional regulator, transcriptional repressor for nem operon